MCLGACVGRPSSFTQAVADTICERLALGESLRAICRSEGMPDQSTVFDWLRKHEDFAKQYARAREDQAEFYLDEIMAIADDSRGDTETRVDSQGNEYDAPNNEWIQRSKLRVDARKWAMSKLAPKKFGDKIGVEHSGSIELADALEAARKRVAK
ncbi:terminase small subunit protein [Ralstonia pickettii]|nr:terminase small subunit protein [Ralstonia pickettii]MBB0096995.1 terminase small subunit protein [Ralstonia pickettii]MBB0107035.1 terminase small subunit protein [Ralstonia pickettii]MBB0127768.1 terminase small subunit protein [Ralstonia pickettii]MBB0160735.1 terminase small subunit protein [Ralstonia pickettii]